MNDQSLPRVEIARGFATRALLVVAALFLVPSPAAPPRDLDGTVDRTTLRAVSSLADFSFDCHDPPFRPVRCRTMEV